MKKYKLYGCEIVFSDGIMNYASDKVAYDQMFERAEKALEQKYNSFKSLDVLVNSLEEYYLVSLKNYAQYYVDYLTQKGCVDLSIEYFLRVAFGSQEPLFYVIHEPVVALYEEIQTELNLKSEYRKLRKATRGRWTGGGVGLGGAIDGTIRAGMLNMMNGALHSAVNGVGNVVSGYGAALKKKKIFNQPEVKKAYIEALERDMGRIFKTYIDIAIDELRINFEIPTVEDCNEANALLLRGIRRFQNNTDELNSFLQKIFELNPFSSKLYFNLLNTYGDPKNELQVIAEMFGCKEYVVKAKLNLYKQFAEKCETASESEIEQLEEEFERLKSRYNIGAIAIRGYYNLYINNKIRLLSDRVKTSKTLDDKRKAFDNCIEYIVGSDIENKQEKIKDFSKHMIKEMNLDYAEGTYNEKQDFLKCIDALINKFKLDIEDYSDIRQPIICFLEESLVHNDVKYDSYDEITCVLEFEKMLSSLENKEETLKLLDVLIKESKVISKNNSMLKKAYEKILEYFLTDDGKIINSVSAIKCSDELKQEIYLMIEERLKLILSRYLTNTQSDSIEKVTNTINGLLPDIAKTKAPNTVKNTLNVIIKSYALKKYMDNNMYEEVMDVINKTKNDAERERLKNLTDDIANKTLEKDIIKAKEDNYEVVITPLMAIAFCVGVVFAVGWILKFILPDGFVNFLQYICYGLLFFLIPAAIKDVIDRNVARKKIKRIIDLGYTLASVRPEKWNGYHNA